jgi:hypothetical protein
MANLRWSIPNAGIMQGYSLTDENNIPLGSLNFPDITKTIARATSGPFIWTFGRSGIIRPRIEIRTVENPPQNVATMELGLSGDSIFILGGRMYRWGREWILSADWLFKDDQGQTLMMFSPSKNPTNFSVKVKTQPRDRLLMEHLGFYVLIAIKEFD